VSLIIVLGTLAVASVMSILIPHKEEGEPL
jgi:hypothetical protein